MSLNQKRRLFPFRLLGSRHGFGIEADRTTVTAILQLVLPHRKASIYFSVSIKVRVESHHQPWRGVPEEPTASHYPTEILLKMYGLVYSD